VRNGGRMSCGWSKCWRKENRWLVHLVVKNVIRNKVIFRRTQLCYMTFNIPCYMFRFFLAIETCLFLGATAPQWAMASLFARFLDHTQRRITVGRTPFDEWSSRRRDLYLTTHNIHNRQTSTPPGEIRINKLSRRAAADLCLRPRGPLGPAYKHVV